MIRGDICYADLGEGFGNEQRGVRPVLIIQNNIGNKYSNTLIVAAITSKKENHHQPTHVLLSKYDGLKTGSIAMLEQLRTIDKSRIKEYVCTLEDWKMKQIDNALKISIGLKEGYNNDRNN